MVSYVVISNVILQLAFIFILKECFAQKLMLIKQVTDLP